MQRILPRELRPTDTRKSCKEFHDLMMIEYNKRCEILKTYNNVSNTVNEELDDNFLTFDEDDVFGFFSKAKNEMSRIKKINDEITNSIKEYESFKADIIKFNDLVKKANEIYDNLSIKSQPFNLTNKLRVDEQILLNAEIRSEIKDFEISVDDKIDQLNIKLRSNNNKLADFKKLILNCVKNDKVDINMCNVCVTNKINICINPCGHTFCSSCIEKMNSKCGMCRGNIDSKIKIYIENDGDDDNTNTNSNEPESYLGVEGLVSTFSGGLTAHIGSTFSDFFSN